MKNDDSLNAVYRLLLLSFALDDLEALAELLKVFLAAQEVD